MDSIPEILEALRAGQMIVLCDDEQRENEGDLVCAAEHASPETINFMLREGRGMMCVALDPAWCDRLDLEPQGRVNTSLGGTGYTVTVDAHSRFGITTGVSAGERARTIQMLVDERTRPGDLVRPGHVQPLRARAGGALVRAGQTEGSVDLCKLAGLAPGAVIIEVMNADGTMARRPELEALCQRHGLKMCSVAQVIHHRLEREKLVERIHERVIQTWEGQWRLVLYRSQVDGGVHVALVLGELGERDAHGRAAEVDEPVLVRMHRQNLLGDVFGEAEHPSGQTLRQAMRMIQQAGRGVVVYLRGDSSEAALLREPSLVQAALAQAGGEAAEQEPTMPAEAQHPAQTGAYGIGCQILRDLGVHRLELITSHPFTPTALSGFDLTIERFVEPG